MPHDLHAAVMQQVLETVAQDGLSKAKKLANISHLLGKYRSELIKELVVRSCGLEVQGGPFAGMRFLDRVAEGCYVPKLLGTYESELHSVVTSLAADQFDCVLNIGCAEGYYAVGLARLMPNTTIYAHDENEVALALCQRLAELNDVTDRVQIGGRFTPDQFGRFEGQRVLVVCDIEGNELELLDPTLAPTLSGCDILVELHELFQEGVSGSLPARFAETHDVTIIRHGSRDPSLFPVLANLPHLDQWLALWEWRSGPTPWAWMQPSRQQDTAS